MPTYEYKCSECDHEFEEFQAISAPPITICPSCGGKTERVISGGAGLIFKGSGFYITDYKKANNKAWTNKAGNGASKPESSESSFSKSADSPSKPSTSGTNKT